MRNLNNIFHHSCHDSLSLCQPYIFRFSAHEWNKFQRYSCFLRFHFQFYIIFSFNLRVRDKIAPFLFCYSLSGPLKKKKKKENRSNPIEDEYVHEGEC